MINRNDDKDISELLCNYLEKQQIKTDDKVCWSYVNIYADFAWVRFQIVLSDGTVRNINGKIKNSILSVNEGSKQITQTVAVMRSCTAKYGTHSSPRRKKLN